MNRSETFVLALVFTAGCGSADTAGDTSIDTGQPDPSDASPQMDALIPVDPGSPDPAPAELPFDPGDPGMDEPSPQCSLVPPDLQLTLVVEGLEAPVFVTGAPGDPDRLFIVEQNGLIRIFLDGTLLPKPFLDVTDHTTGSGERGLLGLAFHPAYAVNGRFFVNYTDNQGDTVVAEYRRSQASPDEADPAPVQILLTVDQPHSNHNGGMVAFGADGNLYVGMGDGGSGGDPQGNGQNAQTLLGALLRLDVDTHPVPPVGNMPGAHPLIWDIGLRNPWRFSFDRKTGDLYIGDVGQGAWEEIHVEPKGQGHRNYGWDIMEGNHCYEPPAGCDTTGLTLPDDEFDHSSGCSVTGGYLYRGPAIDCLEGWYLYGDYCSKRIWAFQWKGTGIAGKTEITDDLDPDGELGAISSFGEDTAGEIYVVSYSGEIYRIDGE